jgi:hypothetical protein
VCCVLTDVYYIVKLYCSVLTFYLPDMDCFVCCVLTVVYYIVKLYCSVLTFSYVHFTVRFYCIALCLLVVPVAQSV